MSANGIAALAARRRLNPKHARAQLKLAELMTTSQNQDILRDAVGRLESVLTASPDNLEATDTLAVAEWRLGKVDDASKRLEEALQRFPASLRSSIQLARLKLSQNDLHGAEEVLKKAEASAPKSPDAAVALGELYLLAGQPDHAEPEFRKAHRAGRENRSCPDGPGGDTTRRQTNGRGGADAAAGIGAAGQAVQTAARNFPLSKRETGRGPEGTRGTGQRRPRGPGRAHAAGLGIFSRWASSRRRKVCWRPS